MATRTALAGLQVSGTAIPVAFGNGSPGGWIGHVTVSADQTVAFASGEVDLTGLTVTVTVNASRRIKISFDGGYAMSGGAGNRAYFRIKEGSTALKERPFAAGTAAVEAASFWVIMTPGAGSHTYKMSLQSLDSGNAVLKANSTQQAELLVEDLGPA